MSTTGPEGEPITAIGLAALEAELEDLETTGRKEIAQRILAARELGDLSENADYHIAKEDQAHLETKIKRLRERRRNAHIVEPDAAVAVFGFGRTAEVRDEETGALMNEIRHAARLVDAAERRPGIAIWQNNGITANQAVAHVHFHVAGTLEEGGTRWGEVPRLSVAETDAIAERLRQLEASLER